MSSCWSCFEVIRNLFSSREEQSDAYKVFEENFPDTVGYHSLYGDEHWLVLPQNDLKRSVSSPDMHNANRLADTDFGVNRDWLQNSQHNPLVGYFVVHDPKIDCSSPQRNVRSRFAVKRRRSILKCKHDDSPNFRKSHIRFSSDASASSNNASNSPD